MSKSSKPTPIAMPNDLAIEIDLVSAISGLSKQDVMRLAMKIGLVDLRACSADLAGLVRQRAADAGQSFADWVTSEKAAKEENSKSKKLIDYNSSRPNHHLKVAEEHGKDDGHEGQH